MTEKSRRHLLRLLFWAAAVFALVMALDPYPPSFPGEPSDKVEHVVAFVVLAALAAAAYPRTGMVRLLAGLVAFGALIEVLQAIPVLHRDSDPLDWIADTVAAGAVLAAIGIWRRRSR